jgi:hypothetical protein
MVRNDYFINLFILRSFPPIYYFCSYYFLIFILFSSTFFFLLSVHAPTWYTLERDHVIDVLELSASVRETWGGPDAATTYQRFASVLEMWGVGRTQQHGPLRKQSVRAASWKLLAGRAAGKITAAWGGKNYRAIGARMSSGPATQTLTGCRQATGKNKRWLIKFYLNISI